jgi:hypothetical protein
MERDGIVSRSEVRLVAVRVDHLLAIAVGRCDHSYAAGLSDAFADAAQAGVDVLDRRDGAAHVPCLGYQSGCRDIDDKNAVWRHLDAAAQLIGDLKACRLRRRLGRASASLADHYLLLPTRRRIGAAVKEPRQVRVSRVLGDLDI